MGKDVNKASRDEIPINLTKVRIYVFPWTLVILMDNVLEVGLFYYLFLI